MKQASIVLSNARWNLAVFSWGSLLRSVSFCCYFLLISTTAQLDTCWAIMKAMKWRRSNTEKDCGSDSTVAWASTTSSATVLEFVLWCAVWQSQSSGCTRAVFDWLPSHLMEAYSLAQQQQSHWPFYIYMKGKQIQSVEGTKHSAAFVRTTHSWQQVYELIQCKLQNTIVM